MKSKKVLALLMAAAVTAAAAVPCMAEELTTLSFSYGGYATVGADAVPRLQEYLAENLGIEMDVWVNSDAETEMTTMLSSGDYSDIIIWNIADRIKTAADGGNLVDLMQYQDQLPAIFENDVYAGAIEYIKDAYGNGEALYGLPMRVGAQEGVYAFSPNLRFDIYQSIGAPQITDWDNFLDVLEEMQNASPETAEGLPTYALSMAGSDLATLWYEVVEPRGVHDTTKAVLVSQDMETVQSIFEEGNALLEGLQWMFEANQRGLLDPDGATQSGEDFQAKISNGQILYTPFSWWGTANYNTDERVNADEPIGYAEVWADCFKLPAFSDNVCGNIRVIALTNDCENVDAALKYLNWLYSDGAELYLNDVEGFLYTVDEEGNRVPTQAYLDNGELAVHEDGGSTAELRTVLGNDPLITAETINAETGAYYGIEAEEAFKAEGELSNLKKEWKEWNGGYRTMYDKYKDSEQLTQLSNGFNLLGSLSDEAVEIQGNILSLLEDTAVQMIYAADQAEFDALWAQFEEDAYALGYEELLTAVTEYYETAKATDEKYSSLVNLQ